MAFTAAGGGEHLPPANISTAGELPFTGRQQNRLNYVHQIRSKTSNSPPEIHNVLGPTGKSFKSTTSPTIHLNPNRPNRAAKTRKKTKSSSRILSPHRPESENSSLASSDTSFKLKSSSTTPLSPGRSANPSQTAKQLQSRSRVASPTRSETEVAALTTGNGLALQLSSTEHKSLPDLPLSPLGTSIKTQLQPKPQHAVISAAATAPGLAGDHLLPKLAAGASSSAGWTCGSCCWSCDVAAGAAPVAAGAAPVAAGAAESAAGSNHAELLVAGAAGSATTLLEPMYSAAAKLNRASTTPAETASLLAAAAGAKLVPTPATPAQDFAVHLNGPPAISLAAKGKETLDMRPALIRRKIQNPNPVSPTQTRIQDPHAQPAKLIQQPLHAQAQTRILTQTHNITQTHTQTQTRDPTTQTHTHQPNNQPPAHSPTPSFTTAHNFAETSFKPTKFSYASITHPAPTLNPNAPTPSSTSFSDVVSGIKDSTIPLRPVSLLRGEPAVNFSTEEIAAMAEPFKLALIGKFSFGRPSMDIIRKFFISLGLKGTSQISLLDNRHILIKLSLDEDYSRIWVRQSWYVHGRGMRIFKWSKDFRCSEESPIVPVWVSLPYLPVHFIHCKAALYSIAAAIGTPLRVDNATAAVSRPSVARILVEYDISQPLLPRLWIGEGASGFWQDIIFEKVPAYCSSCRHLGHRPESCFITNPALRKAPKSTATPQRPAPDSEQPAASAAVHPSQDPSPVGVHPASEIPQATHVDSFGLLGPPAFRDIPPAPGITPAQPSLAIQIVDSGSPITMVFPIEVDDPDVATTPDLPDFPLDDVDTTVVGFNTHCTAIPSSEATSVDRETSDGVQSSDGTETGVGMTTSDDAVIEKLGDQRVIRCSEGFIEVTPRRSFNINRIRRARRQYH